MKATLQEHDGCFSIEFEAESLADAALLVRFGVNRTKEVRHAGTDAHGDGTVTASVVFGKHRRFNSSVPVRS
jgi:hypothetical protein